MCYSTPSIHTQTAWYCCIELPGRFSNTIFVLKLIEASKKQASERKRFNTGSLLVVGEFIFNMEEQKR